MSGAYSSLGQGAQGEDDQFIPGGQSFPLQDQTHHRHRNSSPASGSIGKLARNHTRRHTLRAYDEDDDGGSESGSDLHEQEEPNRDFRVTFMDDPIRTSHDDKDDEDDEDDDLDNLDDFAPLASTKRSYVHPSSAGGKTFSHPCRILATVFGTAMVVALAFALLSLLHLNSVDSNEDKDVNNNNNNSKSETGPDNRVLKPPPGVSIDDFTLSDFKLPPWDWDINTFLPINITNGPKFSTIHWRNGEQYLGVDCPGQANYRYHFPSFAQNEFKEHTTITHGIEDLLPLGEEKYVFVLCPPGKNNANIVFREFDIPDEDEGIPASPPHVDGTKEAPQPLLDDVVMILVDAISRAKFTIEMKTVMETLSTINTTATTAAGGGHRIFDFEHYNVLGQNSPPNKAFIYSGQSIENINGPKHWVWDVYEEQGFKTAHTDGECGGVQGIRDYTTGAITSEYSRLHGKIPAQYQMPQQAWCENHDMHVVADIWGQSCTLPPQVDYDTTLMGGMRWNTPYCAGRMAIHEHIMDNLEGWLASTKGSRRFATYSFMDAHSPVSNNLKDIFMNQ
ncbi:hypothetical protein BGZ83_000045 [Gryganskiella cystojenkinii]|nr:hypothetical protein BGZ83_000045 [Gryganskiella cystojenkinii]